MVSVSSDRSFYFFMGKTVLHAVFCFLPKKMEYANMLNIRCRCEQSLIHAKLGGRSRGFISKVQLEFGFRTQMGLHDNIWWGYVQNQRLKCCYEEYLAFQYEDTTGLKYQECLRLALFSIANNQKSLFAFQMQFNKLISDCLV